jgi:hypothetical protein
MPLRVEGEDGRLPDAMLSGRSASEDAALVREQYARRIGLEGQYSLLNRATLLMVQERQRAVTDLFVRLGWRDLADVRLIEVGCGGGGNLLDFLRLGFMPEHLHGIELLRDRAEQARLVLPQSLGISTGDAAAIESPVPAASQDVVYQSTVFSPTRFGSWNFKN